jgi:hypothetical protein
MNNQANAAVAAVITANAVAPAVNSAVPAVAVIPPGPPALPNGDESLPWTRPFRFLGSGDPIPVRPRGH